LAEDIILKLLDLYVLVEGLGALEEEMVALCQPDGGFDAQVRFTLFIYVVESLLNEIKL